jgi:hypothetical protein
MTLGFASGLYGKKHIAEHGDVFFIMPLAGLARAAQGQAYYALTSILKNGMNPICILLA